MGHTRRQLNLRVSSVLESYKAGREQFRSAEGEQKCPEAYHERKNHKKGRKE